MQIVPTTEVLIKLTQIKRIEISAKTFKLVQIPFMHINTNGSLFLCAGVHGGEFYLIGCFFKSSTTPVQGKEYTTMKDATVDGCVQYCRDSGYPYSGLQAPDQCFCADQYGLHGKSEGLNYLHIMHY